MPITLEALMAQRQDRVAYAYTERDTMLYGLAVGMAQDPSDERELDFVYERRGTLRAVPSLAVTVARHDLIYHCGLQVEKMLHGEQVLTLHRPLPTAASLLADHRVIIVIDKGPARGVLIETDSRVYLQDGTRCSTCTTCTSHAATAAWAAPGRRSDPPTRCHGARPTWCAAPAPRRARRCGTG